MSKRLLALAAVIIGVSTLTADDTNKMAGGDMEKMKAAMMAHATPGEAHKAFDHYMGKWDYTGKWYSPDGSVFPMNGKSECKTMMDGRFMSEHAKGDDPKMPFEGAACWGYDNAKKKYWFAWVDSMTTSLTTGEGTWDAKTKTMTWTSEMYDSGVGKNCKMKEVSVVKDDGSIDKTFYKIEGGKENKEMEFHYKKSK